MVWALLDLLSWQKGLLMWGWRKNFLQFCDLRKVDYCSIYTMLSNQVTKHTCRLTINAGETRDCIYPCFDINILWKALGCGFWISYYSIWSSNTHYIILLWFIYIMYSGLWVILQLLPVSHSTQVHFFKIFILEFKILKIIFG